MVRNLHINKDLLRQTIDGDYRALEYSFRWSASDEGVSYWRAVYNSQNVPIETRHKLMSIAEKQKEGIFI